jgi:hypothetical protein
MACKACHKKKEAFNYIFRVTLDDGFNCQEITIANNGDCNIGEVRDVVIKTLGGLVIKQEYKNVH